MATVGGLTDSLVHSFGKLAINRRPSKSAASRTTNIGTSPDLKDALRDERGSVQQESHGRATPALGSFGRQRSVSSHHSTAESQAAFSAKGQLASRRDALIHAMRIAVPPEVATKPYPENLIPLWSQEGLALLEGSIGPFEDVAACMLPQGPLQCGVTSLAVALNVCRPRGQLRFTVSELHEELRAAIRPLHQFFSASLGEIGALARHHAAADVRTVYASDTSCDTFRSLAQETLESGGCVIANFKRSALGYASPFAGHCSPLAAYNPSADEFLVMDVARRSFQPVWVPTATLFQGMNTLEKPREEHVPATKTRGFILLDAAHAPPRFSI